MDVVGLRFGFCKCSSGKKDYEGKYIAQLNYENFHKIVSNCLKKQTANRTMNQSACSNREKNHIQNPIGFVWLLIGLKSGARFLNQSLSGAIAMA